MVNSPKTVPPGFASLKSPDQFPRAGEIVRVRGAGFSRLRCSWRNTVRQSSRCSFRRVLSTGASENCQLHSFPRSVSHSSFWRPFPCRMHVAHTLPRARFLPVQCIDHLPSAHLGRFAGISFILFPQIPSTGRSPALVGQHLLLPSTQQMVRQVRQSAQDQRWTGTGSDASALIDSLRCTSDTDTLSDVEANSNGFHAAA